jgi:N-acetylmuramoyl-L-alanine amidase
MPSKTKTILISAGHTNNPRSDRGAVGNGFIEGDLAVELRDAVARRLRDRGLSVLEDGADGINDPLTKAIALARKVEIAIEFHWNAGPATATGIEVLAKPRHKKLAQEIAVSLCLTTGIKLRGDKGYKLDSSGQHHRLAFCEAGGLIVEVCFISNAADMRAYRENFSDVVEDLASEIATAAGYVPTVESVKAEITDPKQTTNSNPTSNGLPTDSNLTGTPDTSSSDRAGISAQLSAGVEPVGPTLSEKFNGTIEKVTWAQDKFDAIRNVWSRIPTGNDSIKSLVTFVVSKIVQIFLFIAAVIAGVSMWQWALVAVIFALFTLAYLFRQTWLGAIREKSAAVPTPTFPPTS